MLSSSNRVIVYLADIITTVVILFFFIGAPTTEIYTLSLHDALPILSSLVEPEQPKTRYAPNVTPGATPLRVTPLTVPFAPTMPDTCVPWPLQSSGSASGCGISAPPEPEASYRSPTKSQPVVTRQLAPKHPPSAGLL